MIRSTHPKSTRAWLNMKGWNILEWPSQSPDLNPIENLWWDLKKAVTVRKPKNVTELEAFAHEEWAKIPIVPREEDVEINLIVPSLPIGRAPSPLGASMPG
ncbi:hypothetical protein NFI96_004172 [Prochilodus magdalenae]|nr:hypothetical protein NFI96_004172 [Prochilodus magdalenae]